MPRIRVDAPVSFAQYTRLPRRGKANPAHGSPCPGPEPLPGFQKRAGRQVMIERHRPDPARAELRFRTLYVRNLNP